MRIFKCFFTAVFCVFPLSVSAQTPAGAPDGPTEISVTGDSGFAIAPDFVRLTVELEQTSATAADAQSALDSRMLKLGEQLKSIDPGVVVRLRGERYLPATPGMLGLKAGSTFTLRRTLAVDSQKPSLSGKLVDSALQSAASIVTDVNYSVSSNQQPLLAAIEEASKRAKQKAELTATTLGIALGPIFSSVVTEEPEAEALRQQLQSGQSAADYGDRVQRVYVTLRYNIARSVPLVK